jgi:hypothetical protein
MSGSKKAKASSWPNELREPMEIPAVKRVFGSLAPPSGPDASLMRQEIKRRIGLIAAALNVGHPAKWDDDWAALLVAVCNKWDIPAFQSPKPKRGPQKVWTSERLCQLFADVQALLARRGRLSEMAACTYISKHTKEYENRYPIGVGALTLHRQYMEAKSIISTDWDFRYENLRVQVGLLNQPDYGPEIVRLAIERFAVVRN